MVLMNYQLQFFLFFFFWYSVFEQEPLVCGGRSVSRVIDEALLKDSACTIESVHG